MRLVPGTQLRINDEGDLEAFDGENWVPAIFV